MNAKNDPSKLYKTEAIDMHLCRQEDFDNIGNPEFYGILKSTGYANSILCPDFKNAVLQSNIAAPNGQLVSLAAVECQADDYCERDEAKRFQFLDNL